MISGDPIALSAIATLRTELSLNCAEPTEEPAKSACLMEPSCIFSPLMMPTSKLKLAPLASCVIKMVGNVLMMGSVVKVREFKSCSSTLTVLPAESVRVRFPSTTSKLSLRLLISVMVLLASLKVYVPSPLSTRLIFPELVKASQRFNHWAPS